MVKFVALYRTPPDVEAFEKRYTEEHLPLVRQFPDLRVVDPAFERQPIGAQVGVASPEVGIEKEMRDHAGSVRASRCNASTRKNAGLCPRGAMADATEATALPATEATMVLHATEAMAPAARAAATMEVRRMAILRMAILTVPCLRKAARSSS